jgi:hypothetical protein
MRYCNAPSNEKEEAMAKKEKARAKAGGALANALRVLKLPDDTEVDLKFERYHVEGAVKAQDRAELVSMAREVWGKVPQAEKTCEEIGGWLLKVFDAKEMAANPESNILPENPEGKEKTMKTATAKKIDDAPKHEAKTEKVEKAKVAPKDSHERAIAAAKAKKVATVTPITKKVAGDEPTWREAVALALKKAGGVKVGTQAVWGKLKAIIPGKIEKLAKGPHPDNAYRAMIMQLMKYHKKVDRGVWTLKEVKE